jgi:hypothetical protein
MDENHDVFIVGFNIEKHDAYFACRRDKLIVRAAQGVYFRAGVDAAKLFDTYGIRLANYFFQKAALTHSTAWYKRPTHGRVFVGGEYPYKKVIAPTAGDFQIVQSLVNPRTDDSRMYELVEFEDPFGKFEMYCATAEMTAIHLMDATKKNVEKHLPEVEIRAIFAKLHEKYGSKAQLLTALEEIAEVAEKENEFDRLLKYYFRRDRS